MKQDTDRQILPLKRSGFASKTMCGFSLIEVVIAVGIASFALVTIMGLLPVGLSTFKSTINTAVGTQIAQRIFNDLEIANFANIPISTNRFFDEQGTELTSSGASNAPNCIYWAQVNRAASTTFLNTTSTNLYTITVMVAYNPRGSLPAAKVFAQSNPATLTFSTFIGHNQ